MYFAKNIGKDIGKNVSKILSGKNSQKRIDPAKNFAAYSLKTVLIRAIQKAIQTTDDVIDNKIANKITKISTTSPQNSSGTVANEAEILDLIKKHLKKDMYLRKRGKILLD